MTISVRLVHDLMTRHPATLAPGELLTVARDVMRLGRLRHVPIVDDAGELVGLLSDRDLTCGALFRACGIDSEMEKRILARIEVREVMANRVSTTTPYTSLADAAKEMNRRKIRCLPVIENDVVVGMLTENDFVLALIDPYSRMEPGIFEKESLSSGKDDHLGELENECDRLRTIRDEIRVQLQLATMEARDGFAVAEQQWAQLEHELAAMGGMGDGPLNDEMARIAKNFMKEIGAVYDDLRRKMGTH